MDLNEPEEFTFEEELLLLQPSTPSMCNFSTRLYAQSPSKLEVGGSSVTETAGGREEGVMVVKK